MNLHLTTAVVGYTPEMDAAVRALDKRRPLMAALAKRGEIRLRSHFALLEQRPNKKGWAKTHFWSGVRSKTSANNITETSADVTIASREFRLRLQGGTVKPRERKFLSLPAVEEAYGRSPRTFGDRFQFAIDAEFGPVLEDKSTHAVFYFLRRKTTHKPNPGVLPTQQQLSIAMLAETGMFLARVRRRALTQP